MPTYKKTPKGVKGHGRLGVEFDPTHKPREGYPKTAKEQQDRLDAELARNSEMQRRKPNPEKMASGGCIGPECGGCESGDCYAKGGGVRRHEPPGEEEVGVHSSIAKYQPGKSGGISVAGERLRTGDSGISKRMHETNLEDLKAMKKPHLYAEGGSVNSWTKREDNERGVHGSPARNGQSVAGMHVRGAHMGVHDKDDALGAAKIRHKKMLGEMKEMPKPKLYAEGGEVSDGEPEMDDELKHAMGGEFMDAMERKDRKGIMSALEAIVLSCRGK